MLLASYHTPSQSFVINKNAGKLSSRTNSESISSLLVDEGVIARLFEPDLELAPRSAPDTAVSWILRVLSAEMPWQLANDATQSIWPLKQLKKASRPGAPLMSRCRSELCSCTCALIIDGSLLVCVPSRLFLRPSFLLARRGNVDKSVGDDHDGFRYCRSITTPDLEYHRHAWRWMTLPAAGFMAARSDLLHARAGPQASPEPTMDR